MKAVAVAALCVLALLAHLSESAQAETKISPEYGAPQELRDRYAHLGATFTCLTGGKVIPTDRVNDDYCDCEDGSDEPGTAACSNTKVLQPQSESSRWEFTCKNEGFKSRGIPHRYVNDGICDCCDGSDEYSSGVKCANICAKREKEEEVEQREVERVKQVATKVRAEMRRKAEEAKTSGAKDLSVDRENLVVAEQELASLEKEQPALDAKEAADKEELKAQYEKRLQEWDERQAEKEKGTDVDGAQKSDYECIMWRQTTRCSGSGEREPSSDKSCDTTIETISSGYCECLHKETGETVKHERNCGHPELNCTYMCAHDGEGDENKVLDMDDGTSYQDPLAKEARNKINNLQKKISSLKSSIAEAERSTAKPVDTEDLLRTLKDQCYQYNGDPEYTYELCLFSNTHQYDKNTKNGPSLGSWGRFAENTYSLWSSSAGDLTHMIYENGQRCWNGHVRKTDVYLICGEENKLLSIEEPSMCTYSMAFATPVMCD